MSERLPPIVVSAEDNASRVFRGVGQNAKRHLGDEVERAADQGKRGLRDFARSGQDVGRALDEIGTAVGTVVGGMALLGRNARDAERQQDALHRAYGASADQLIAFSEAIQDNTNFSNDAARQAALTGASLAQNYQLGADEIENLITVSANLATIHGIDLPDAMMRVSGAIRGEGEAAELLGLNMSDAAVAAQAAAAGLDGWTTSMTESEKAAFRYTLLMDQAAFATGAAADAAEGAAGRGQDLIHWLDDTAEAAGAALGPAGEFLSVAGNLALAAPLAGNALGRMAQGLGKLAESQRLATLATSSLGLAVGPVGLIAAAGLATVAVLALGDAEDHMGLRAQEAAAHTETLVDALTDLAVAQVPQVAYEQAQALVSLTETVIGLTTATEDGDNAWLRYAAAVGVEGPRALVAIDTAVRDFALSQEQLGGVVADVNEILTYQGENFEFVRRVLDETTQLYLNGRITADQYAASVNALNEEKETLGVRARYAAGGVDLYAAAIAEAERRTYPYTAATDLATTATLDYLDAQQATAAATELQTQRLEEQDAALAANAAGLEEVAAALDTETAARDAGRAAQQEDRDARQAEAEATIAQRDALFDLMFVRDDEIATLAAVGGAYANNIALFDAAAAAIGRQTAELTEYQAALRLANDGVLTLADQQAILTTRQDELGGALGDYRTQLGYTEEAERILRERQAAGLALTQQQIDFLTTVDATQATAAGSAEELAIQQGILAQSWLENAESQQALADSNGVLADTFGELTELLGDFLADWRELLGLPPADNLAVPDDVIGSWFNLQNAIKGATGVAGDASGGPNVDPVTGVPANQPPPPQSTLGGPFRGGGAARIDPTVVTILPDDQVTATVVAIEADLTELTRERWTAELFANAAALNRTVGGAEDQLRRVVDGHYEADLLANAADAYGDIAGVRGVLNALDGASATVDAYANTQTARNQLNALTGYQGDAIIQVRTVNVGPTPYRHGGVVPRDPFPHAQHGMVVTVGEAGPENVFLPGGSYVQNAPASRAHGLASQRGGGDIHIHAPVTIVARDGNVYDQLAAWARGAGR